MNPYKGCVNIACSDPGVPGALTKYLKHCIGFEYIVINPLCNPFRFTEALNMAEQCDLLILDAFINGDPKGFHFTKQMKKKTLLLFYSGELNIEDEGPFWLVFPHKLYKLKEKITDITKKPQIKYIKYLDLENKYPLLKEFKNHHF